MSRLTNYKAQQPSAGATPMNAGMLQRKCDCGTHTVAGGKCDACSRKESPALQRSAAGRGHTPGLPPVVGEVLDSPGRPLDAGARSFMESRFGHDFSRVRVHTDSMAAESARAVNSHAYTVGSDLVFDSGKYAPETEAGRRLLAHELAHVVQQGRAGDSAQAKSTDISQPGDAAELRADAAAEAVLRGGQVPDVGDAAGDTLHRAVRVNGGEFDTNHYTVINNAAGADPATNVGKQVGADIEIKFTPNDLVETTQIGMTQTVKTLRNNAAGGPVTTPSNARRAFPDFLTAGEGDVGRGIDRVDFATDPATGNPSTLPTTSPLYGVHNRPANPATGAPAAVATNLTGTAPGGTAQFGSHTRRPDRRFNPPVDAIIRDTPNRRIAFAGQRWEQSFETTALILAGPMSGTYLGSVAWGWQSDAAGNATLNPATLTRVSAGAPTSDFMDAATKWNAMTMAQPGTGTPGVPGSETVHQTVDLPIITETLDPGATLAADRPTAQLIAYIAFLDFEINRVMPAGTNRTNWLFQKRAMEAELRRRSMQVNVHVVRATPGPGADDVYVKVTCGGHVFRTPERGLNDGQSAVFTIPLRDLVPINGPFTIEVFDADAVSADDLIVRMSGRPGLNAPLRNTTTMERADYRVVASLP